MGDKELSIAGILFPVDRAVSLRVVLFAISLGCLGFITQGFVWFSEVIMETSTPGGAMVYGLCVAAIIGALLNGYANDDLLVSCGIAFGPVLGFVLFPAALWVSGTTPVLSETAETALLIGVGTAIVGSMAGLGGVWLGRRFGGGRSSPSFE